MWTPFARSFGRAGLFRMGLGGGLDGFEICCHEAV